MKLPNNLALPDNARPNLTNKTERGKPMKPANRWPVLFLALLFVMSYTFSFHVLAGTVEQPEPADSAEAEKDTASENRETIWIHYADGHTEEHEFVLEPDTEIPPLAPYLP